MIRSAHTAWLSWLWRVQRRVVLTRRHLRAPSDHAQRCAGSSLALPKWRTLLVAALPSCSPATRPPVQTLSTRSVVPAARPPVVTLPAASHLGRVFFAPVPDGRRAIGRGARCDGGAGPRNDVMVAGCGLWLLLMPVTEGEGVFIGTQWQCASHSDFALHIATKRARGYVGRDTSDWQARYGPSTKLSLRFDHHCIRLHARSGTA